MGNDYKKLMSGVIAVTSLATAGRTYAAQNHGNVPSQNNGDSNSPNTCSTNNLGDGETHLKSELATYPGDPVPTVVTSGGKITLNPGNGSAAAYNSLLDWLYSRNGAEGTRIVSLNGKFFINVARLGETEQLVRISLPQRPQSAGDTPGGGIPSRPTKVAGT